MSSRILVVGCGGREHVIAKTLKKDGAKVYCIGDYVNPGIFTISEKYCTDMTKLVEFTKLNRIDIAIIGPETFLERGIADLLEAIDVPCIGPKSNSAKLETSKIFTRLMMKREWNMEEYIPRFSVVSMNATHPSTSQTESKDPFPPEYNLREFSMDDLKQIKERTMNEYVIKADGLQSGKGVRVSKEHFSDVDGIYTHCYGMIKDEKPFLIEEKLVGDEFSVMSFCDGQHIRHMPIVSDYKRAFNGDTGPNTGGMGSVSYPNHRLDFLTESDVEVAQTLNEMTFNAIQNYTEEEYKGILYGGFMKTTDGKIKVIEYNCRFGDPECINVLSLLETSFLNICKGIVEGTLNTVDIKYRNKYTVCRYLVPNGYPENPSKNHEIYVSGTNNDNLIYASVNPNNLSKLDDVQAHLLDFTKLLQLGSRTIAGIAVGDTLQDATEMVITELNKVSGPLWQRTDIGETGETKSSQSQSSYLDCGVDITKGNEIVSNIGKHIVNTYNENVYGDFGDFGGMFKFKGSILVSSTDGVGTKSILAHDVFGNKSLVNLGKDLVNHCVNDILVKGAHPLFFLDYFASSNIDKDAVELFVEGISQSCKSTECVLLGGETAEMPGVYIDGKMDFVGTIVGCLDEKDVIDGKRDVKKNDVVIGLRSSGPHTNGYSLIRKLVRDELLDDEFVKTLLEPHRCYYRDVKRIRERSIPIHALCHITGGGLIENPKRVLPDGLSLKLNDDFEISDMFKILQVKGNISDNEMLRVFNCGVGMMIITSEMYKNDILDMFRGNYATEIGKIV